MRERQTRENSLALKITTQLDHKDLKVLEHAQSVGKIHSNGTTPPTRKSTLWYRLRPRVHCESLKDVMKLADELM